MTNLVIETLSLPDDADKWHLVMDFLIMRKEVFIERKHWDLSTDGDYEWEQYDIVSHSTYVIAHEDNKVVAGARLVRSDAKVGSSGGYSYMIKDAYDELIEIPSDICSSSPPDNDLVWELTRMVSTDRSQKTHLSLLRSAAEFILKNGGTHCLFLGPPAFIRMGRRLGFTLERLGLVSGDETGRYLVMNFPVAEFDL